jgi:hypothetical protein
MVDPPITEITPWVRYPSAILFVVFIFVVVGYAGVRNRRQLQRFGARYGLDYIENGRWDADVPSYSMLASLGPMGTEARVRIAAEGVLEGARVSVFECGYHRDRVAPAGYPVTAVQIWTESSLPFFTLRPEKLRHKLAALAGKDDIDIDECPGFSRRFLLQGDAPAAVRALFTPEVCALLEQEPRLFAESTGNGLLLYHKPRMLRYTRFREGDIERLIRLGLAWKGLLDTPGQQP